MQWVEVDDDLAHYNAFTALDDVLGWFRDDGYMRVDMADLVAEHVDRVFEDEE